MIHSNILSGVNGVAHGFFTRQGGNSEGIYASLNCGPGSSDDTDAVQRNRAVAAEALGAAPDALLTLYQVHSPTVVVVDKPWTRADAPQADAMVTSTPGIAIGVLTADCAPVLFADDTGSVIGAAHAGWKGACGGVLEATVAGMEGLGVERSSIRAVLGPCIRQQSYEVGADMRDQLVALRADDAEFFAAGEREGHFQFDLAGYVLMRLVRTGVGMIEDTPGDTYGDEELFFSYRRATHRSEPDYGRQLSAITISQGF